MANFRYQVVDATGKTTEGVIEAASIGEATKKLKADGKYVSSLTLDKGPGLAGMEIGSPKLSTKDLVLITRQLASLLSAGITVVRALDMLYQQVESKKAKKCIGEIYEAVQSGRSLSEAFREQKGVVPNIFISMISAFVGVAIVALPSGIITAGYLDELKAKREQKMARKISKQQKQNQIEEPYEEMD